MFLDLFQAFELGVELMMPREKNCDLKHEGTAANDETCYG